MKHVRFLGQESAQRCCPCKVLVLFDLLKDTKLDLVTFLPRPLRQCHDHKHNRVGATIQMLFSQFFSEYVLLVDSCHACTENNIITNAYDDLLSEFRGKGLREDAQQRGTQLRIRELSIRKFQWLLPCLLGKENEKNSMRFPKDILRKFKGSSEHSKSKMMP